MLWYAIPHKRRKQRCDTLAVEVYMAAVGQPMQQHLEGSLEKVAEMTIAPAELKKALGRFAVLDVRYIFVTASLFL